MATLVLSTVGTALAGPIGGLLGSLVGQSIDQQLLGGGGRKGPRLGDLSVQTSSYGTPIPRIYGTMRVAGTVIWATDLKEDSELQGDGKSQPETVVYTYSASFAVALSCRRAASVRRIWADGKLIRGSAGDFKIATKFRFHPGSESQTVDPLIGSIEGMGLSPAYRGLAVAVFEDLQLASFGNRIPALTFEVVADPGDGIAIADLLADASDGAVQCEDERLVGGYAAHGENREAAIAPLIEAFAVELYADGDVLKSPLDDGLRLPAVEQLGASAGVLGTALIQREQAAAAALPATVSLSYYDPARDYQTGQARASTPVPSRTSRALTLPCVLEAGVAKSAAENLILRAWALRERLIVRLPPTYLDLRPGSSMRLPGVAGDWIAEDVDIERFVVTATLRPIWGHAGSRSADPGRSLPQPDIIAAPTRLALFDLPDPASSQPILALAAASPNAGWTPVPIEIAFGGTVMASRAAPVETVLGQALTLLGQGQPFLIDMVNSVDVQLADPEHGLESRDPLALAMGANLAAVGDELIQFAKAEALAPGMFRLSGLLRGRRGSEWAMSGHTPSENFALLNPLALKAIALPIGTVGSTLTVTARGPGDHENPIIVSRIVNGEAMRPLSPAHPIASLEPDGTLSVTWVPRSRLAWSLADEVEAPADPEVQGYRLHVAGSTGSIVRDYAETQAIFSAAEVDSLGNGPIEVQLRQVGLQMLSQPAIITLDN